jgi:hypothetical protein
MGPVRFDGFTVFYVQSFRKCVCVVVRLACVMCSVVPSCASGVSGAILVGASASGAVLSNFWSSRTNESRVSK